MSDVTLTASEIKTLLALLTPVCDTPQPMDILAAAGDSREFLGKKLHEAEHIHHAVTQTSFGGAICACGHYMGVWWCPSSPDHVRHYDNGDWDHCDYCSQPEERK